MNIFFLQYLSYSTYQHQSVANRIFSNALIFKL